MDFGAKLRLLRTLRQLSQRELAELANTNNVFISHIERGKMMPSPDLETRLRETLGWDEVAESAMELLARHIMRKVT